MAQFSPVHTDYNPILLSLEFCVLSDDESQWHCQTIRIGRRVIFLSPIVPSFGLVILWLRRWDLANVNLRKTPLRVCCAVVEAFYRDFIFIRMPRRFSSQSIPMARQHPLKFKAIAVNLPLLVRGVAYANFAEFGWNRSSKTNFSGWRLWSSTEAILKNTLPLNEWDKVWY